MDKKDFAKLIKEKRKELDKTQAQLAELLGISWISIWRWENEKQTPNQAIMRLWADKIKDLT